VRLSWSYICLKLDFFAIYQGVGHYFAALLAILPAMLLSAPAHAEWREARTPHFILYSQGNEEELQTLIRHLEAHHWLLNQITTGMRAEQPPSPPITIYFLRNTQAVIGAAHVNEATGVYFPLEDGPIIVTNRREGINTLDTVIHEYAHHFIAQYLRTIYPRWYAEGFAEMVGVSHLHTNGHIYFGEAPAGRLEANLAAYWVPAGRILARPTRRRPNSDAAHYQQYWLMAHYFTFAPDGPQRLANYIDLLNANRPDSEAITALGASSEEIDERLRSYRNRQQFTFRPIVVPINELPSAVIRTLGPAESAAIPGEIEVRMVEAYRRSARPRQRLIAATWALTQQFSGNAAIQRLHARALLADQQWGPAEAAADRALAIAPDDVSALIIKGMASLHRASGAGLRPLESEQFSTLRQPLIRANRLAPLDPMPLLANFRSYGIARIPPNDAALQGLLAAINLRPQAQEMRVLLAAEWIRRRQLADARQLLLPLAGTPHASNYQTHAQAVIAWIDDGAIGAPPTPVTDAES
jgi:hypothetical protein